MVGGGGGGIQSFCTLLLNVYYYIAVITQTQEYVKNIFYCFLNYPGIRLIIMQPVCKITVVRTKQK